MRYLSIATIGPRRALQCAFFSIVFTSMGLKRTSLFYRIKRLVGRAVGDFNLISAGDHIAVAVSGGKDSLALLHLLHELRRRAPVAYRLTAVLIDPGHPGFEKEILADYLHGQGLGFQIVATDIAGIVEKKRTPGTSYCSFCARLRRGALYSEADRLGCNKIALGHHLDDFIETLLLNQFFVGTLGAMSPRMTADNGRHTVVRPLVYVTEDIVEAFARENRFPVISCACPVCGEDNQQRRRMKQLIAQLQEEVPHIKQSMLRALGNVQPRYLMDPNVTKTLPGHEER